MKNMPPNINNDWEVIRVTSPHSLDYISLCSSCRHNTACTFQEDRQTPAFFCEEFEIDPRPLTKKAGIEIVESGPSAAAGKDDSSEFIGLCSNCDNRKTCEYPKPEGGIWHCEEYQ